MPGYAFNKRTRLSPLLKTTIKSKDLEMDAEGNHKKGKKIVYVNACAPRSSSCSTILPCTARSPSLTRRLPLQWWCLFGMEWAPLRPPHKNGLRGKGPLSAPLMAGLGSATGQARGSAPPPQGKGSLPCSSPKRELCCRLLRSHSQCTGTDYKK